MAVGTSKPTVSADKDGFFSVKNKMLVGVGFLSSSFPLFYIGTIEFFEFLTIVQKIMDFCQLINHFFFPLKLM